MRADPRQVAILVSLAASVVMLAGKLLAYFLTHSAAIFSDAAESVVHGAATGLAAYSVWYAARPADRCHPYGHGRIAYFSAGAEGALVFAASLAVLWSGVESLVHGQTLRNLGLGSGIAGGLALINLGLGLTLVRIGRKHNALILEANGKHVLSDMWTTVAALAGVGLVMLTGLTWLDPAAALLIGAYIMYSGVSLLRRSVSGLMDKVDPALAETLVASLRAQKQSGSIADFHEVRCRRLDDQIWVDLHVLVPGEVPMSDAHARVTRLETAVRASFPRDKVQITSHIEPADHEAAHPGGHDTPTEPLG